MRSAIACVATAAFWFLVRFGGIFHAMRLVMLLDSAMFGAGRRSLRHIFYIQFASSALPTFLATVGGVVIMVVFKRDTWAIWTLAAIFFISRLLAQRIQPTGATPEVVQMGEQTIKASCSGEYVGFYAGLLVSLLGAFVLYMR